MGQGEIIKFLEGCNEPVTRKQIAEGMDENPIKISHLIASLLKWSEIEFIEYSGKEVKEKAGYSSGRRTRFYYLKGKIKN
tara:strand:+ start:2064 stop:2303 length:240 start_codon:yes stop_codon:yes gene_type:complete